MAKEEKGNGIESAQTAHVFNEEEMELLRDLEKQEELMRKQAETSRKPSSACVKIQMVPNSIKVRGGKDYYTPSEISIGPIHTWSIEHDHNRDLKLQLAARFVADSGRSREDMLGRVKANLDEIKSCFEESVLVRSRWDRVLASVLFIDACFVLQFIYEMIHKELAKFGISSWLQNSIQQDLFLLENQLPFRLLNILIDYSAKKRELTESICTFMDNNLLSMNESHQTSRDWLVDYVPVHFLHVLRRYLLLPMTTGCYTELVCWTYFSKFLDGFQKKYPPKQQPNAIPKRPRSFRNVQDLKNVGIEIKPPDAYYGPFQISFSRWWIFKATLRVPALNVDSSTVTKLLNMVAYEMCPDNYDSDYGVSSYLSLMDSLVDTEQDVCDLRASHVLRYRLGSDDGVARLFNDIGSILVTTDAYKEVQEQIQKHYESKMARWWAQFYETYFSSPWKVLALIGGALVLFFGGVSTYYAMYPLKMENSQIIEI